MPSLSLPCSGHERDPEDLERPENLKRMTRTGKCLVLEGSFEWKCAPLSRTVFWMFFAYIFHENSQRALCVAFLSTSKLFFALYTNIS